jgi:molybdopterin adenylyltransferase
MRRAGNRAQDRDDRIGFFAAFLKMNLDESQIRAAILTVSDRSARGERADASGPALVSWLEQRSVAIGYTTILADEPKAIAAQLTEWADSGTCDVILTTGGTGVSTRDRTPEATLEVLEFTIPGLAEAMRAESFKRTPHAALSRALAGVRKQTLIVNLPGSPAGAVENLAVVWPAIVHAIETIHGDTSDCAKTPEPEAD